MSWRVYPISYTSFPFSERSKFWSHGDVYIRFIFIISLGKSPLLQSFQTTFLSPLVQVTTCLWEVKKVKTFPAISWDSACQQENIHRFFSTLLFLDWKAGYVMFFSNVHSLGKVLRCLCFFMEIAGFFIVNWLMSTWWQWKPIGSGPCSSMAAPLYANATKRGRWKEWGHGSGGCQGIWTPKWWLVLVKTAGSRCSWREACFFWGGCL